MAIIFPTSCKNTTAGALREIKEQGYTTAGGGLFSKRMLGSLGPKAYFDKTEPVGAFMDTLDLTKRQIEENTEAILSSGRKLVDTAKDANKQMTDVTGKFRDGTERLGNAIDKLMKVAGRNDFAETVKLTGELVDSLERLAVLEEKGLLDKVMRAMRN
jgi:hypothetical protein